MIENVTATGDRGRVINDLATQALTNGCVMSICTEKNSIN